MAERRMFTKKITDDEGFYSLSSSAQLLYFHLSMSADDDGFCNQLSLCMFKAHASVTDLEVLLEKRYLYQFENGVIVIKHWRMANALRKDRYTKTIFKKELSMLQVDENGAYTMKNNGLATNWQPTGNQLATNWQPSIGKDSIGKYSIDKDSILEKEIYKEKETQDVVVDCVKPNKNMIPPTLDMVKDYCVERNNNVDAEQFVDFYESKGWLVGKTKMKDWQAAVRNWEKKDKKSKKNNDVFDEWANA